MVGHVKRAAGVASDPASRPRRVVIVAFPDVNLLDLAGPSEVFSSIAEAKGREAETGEYSIEFVSTTWERQIRTSGGVSVSADRPIFEWK
jgi:transcriptional regulator GlxA family with amidase domain